MFLSHTTNLMAASAALICSVAGPAYAQTVQIDIAPQPLGSALNQVAIQGRSQILFRPDVVAGRTAPAVRDSMTVKAALDRLLEHSGLQHRQDRNVILVDKPTRISMRADAAPAMAALAPLASDMAVAEEAPAPSNQLDEIIVTAQKREESLQDTPISIAVLGGDELKARGLTALADFASGAVPSLRVIPQQGRPSTLNITMRGINPGDPSQVSRDQAVGVYLDGVYLGRAQGLGSEMYDLQRMEILRGPQGTLFGRNAVGGAISMVSKRPSGTFSGDITAGVGNFDWRTVKAHLNLPEFAGFSIKLDGVWTKRDGWVENPLADASDWAAVDRRGGRISVLWEPADNLELLYSFDISRDASTVGYQQIVRLPGAPPFPAIFYDEPKRVKRGRVGVPLEPSLGKVHGHSLNATWDLSDDLTVRSITAYRKLEQAQYTNSGGLLTPYTPNGVFGRVSYADVHQDQFSQEVQLLGNFNNLEFVAGAFYFEEDATDLAFTPFSAMFNGDGTGYRLLPIDFESPRFPDRGSDINARSTALFGQATYTPGILDERLHLTGGLRWTSDRKKGALTRSRGAVIDIPFKFSSDRLDPAFTVAYDWTDDVNTYVRWGQAYRAGGANSRSLTYRPFDEEEVSTWEIGAKTELFDRRVRFNLAAFHTTYKNRQVDFVNPASPSNLETLNAPESTTIKGVELDLTARLAPGLTLTGGYAFTDAEAAVDRNPFTDQLQEGAVLYTPKHSAVLGLDHEMSVLDDATLTTHVDAVYSSSFFTGGADQPKTGSYTMLNARVTLGDLEMRDGGAKLAFSLWGKNLTNARWKLFSFDIAGPGLANVSTAVWNEPRTYGVEAKVNF